MLQFQYPALSKEERGQNKLSWYIIPPLRCKLPAASWKRTMGQPLLYINDCHPMKKFKEKLKELGNWKCSFAALHIQVLRSVSINLLSLLILMLLFVFVFYLQHLISWYVHLICGNYAARGNCACYAITVSMKRRENFFQHSIDSLQFCVRIFKE